MIDTLCEKALHPARTVAQSIKSTGKNAVGCFPIYTPEELVYAAGFLPVGMWGGTTEIKLADRYLQGFCCSIMRANIEYGLRGIYKNLKAVLIPTLCDTLKCICENWKVAVPTIPVIPVVYPQNKDTEAGRNYLREEFERVQTALETIAGHKTEAGALDDAVQLYESYRAEMRRFTVLAADHPQTINAKVRHLIIKAAYFMDKKEFTAELNALNDALAQMPKEKCNVRIVTTGLISEPVGVLDILAKNDIAIVADDVAQESRQFRVKGRKADDAMSCMIMRMVDLHGCPFLFDPQKTRGKNLIDLVKDNRADGVLTLMMKFCDPDEFDYPIYKRELEAENIPLLYIEVEQSMDSFSQIETRIQSFAEMLS